MTLPASTLVVATGNNLQIAGDLCRRALPIEMDAGVESPELRTFQRDLIPWAIEYRQRLVSTALAILAAHRRAGQPVPSSFAPLGSFEAWSRTICGALVWLGQDDPREGMQANRAGDPKRLLLARVLTGMADLFGEAQWLKVGAILEGAKGAHERCPTLLDAIEEITARSRDEKGAKIMLGRWFEAEKGRVVAGMRLAVDRDEHTKCNTWRAERCG